MLPHCSIITVIKCQTLTQPDLTAAEMAARERKLARKEEVTREHDKIIGEIEQSDQTCLGTAMKNVYTLGHVGRFQKKLDKRIRFAVENLFGPNYTFLALERILTALKAS